MLTRASAESMRMAISAPVISNEKIALGMPLRIEADRQKSRPRVDLPTPDDPTSATVSPKRQ